MGSKLLGVMTGVALLASVGVANAKGPVMTDAQLDKVVAGNAGVSAFAEEAATVNGLGALSNGTAHLSDNPAGAGHTAAADIVAIFATLAPGSIVNLNAFAF